MNISGTIIVIVDDLTNNASGAISECNLRKRTFGNFDIHILANSHLLRRCICQETSGVKGKPRGLCIIVSRGYEFGAVLNETVSGDNHVLLSRIKSEIISQTLTSGFSVCQCQNCIGDVADSLGFKHILTAIREVRVSLRLTRELNSLRRESIRDHTLTSSL